jgi:hypothetical protein
VRKRPRPGRPRPDQRAEHGQGRDGVDRREVLEGLRGDLAEALAGHQGPAAPFARDPFRQAHHEAPVQDHPQRLGALDPDPRLDVGERHHVQAGLELPVVEHAGEVARLLLGGLVDQRIAVEVHEVAAAAPAHHAPSRHRRVDPAAQQHRHPPAGAHGQATRAGNLLVANEDLVLLDAHENLRLGALQAHGQPGRLVHDRADLPVDPGRGERKGLVRPLRCDAEMGRAAGREVLRDGGTDQLQFAREAADAHGVGDAADLRDPGERGIEIDLRLDQDAPGVRAHLARPQLPERRADVVAQGALETRPVAALERQLVEVDRQLMHGEPVL